VNSEEVKVDLLRKSSFSVVYRKKPLKNQGLFVFLRETNILHHCTFFSDLLELNLRLYRILEKKMLFRYNIDRKKKCEDFSKPIRHHKLPIRQKSTILRFCLLQ